MRNVFLILLILPIVLLANDPQEYAYPDNIVRILDPCQTEEQQEICDQIIELLEWDKQLHEDLDQLMEGLGK